MKRSDFPDMFDEAALWVARMDAGDWTQENEEALQRWFAGDARRKGVFLQAHAAWISAELTPDVPVHSTRKPPLYKRRRILVGGAAMAASLVGGVALLRTGTIYETDIGEIRRVPLADGSIAALNTGTKLGVSLTTVDRQVRIDRGEAWFQVAKNRARPFIVEAGKARAVAIGTAFSVRRRDIGTDILVTEGVVEVWSTAEEGRKIRLVAGEGAFIAEDAVIRTERTVPSSIDRTLAWRSGRIDLVGTSLAYAVGEFNRYNRRKIVLIDPKLGTELFDGSFRIDDVDGFAKAVKSSLDVPVRLDDRNDILIGRPSYT